MRPPFRAAVASAKLCAPESDLWHAWKIDDNVAKCMSVSLLVKLKRPMAIGEIEAAASAALRDILNLDRDPALWAKLDKEYPVGKDTGNVLANDSKLIVCRLSGHCEQVRIRPFTVPSDGVYRFVDQDYVSIGCHAGLPPLCWALVAAVAVGVARRQEARSRIPPLSLQMMQRSSHQLSSPALYGCRRHRPT